MGFWFEVVVLSLLFAISINLQGIYLLMKKIDAENKVENANSD